MVQVSRRALLTRAGVGTGAGVIALLGGAAVPALAAPGETDLANARLICSSKSASSGTFSGDSPEAPGGAVMVIHTVAKDPRFLPLTPDPPNLSCSCNPSDIAGPIVTGLSV